MGNNQIVEELMALETGYITDALVRLKCGGWLDFVRPPRPGCKFAGPAFTVKAEADPVGVQTWAFYEAIDRMEPGYVFIENGNCTAAIFGANIAKCIRNQGALAFVSEGYGRDKAESTQLTMPVYCKGYTTTPAVSMKVTGIDVPIDFGGNLIHPGDYIVGDDDGVVWIQKERVEDVIAFAKIDAEYEAKLAEATAAGASAMEVFELIKAKRNIKI